MSKNTKFTVKEIRIVDDILTYTGTFNNKGERVPRSDYSMEQLVHVDSFNDSVKKVNEDYDNLVESKKKQVEESKNEEINARDNLFRDLRKEYEENKDEDVKKKIDTLFNVIARVASVDAVIINELNNDEELKKAYHDDEHDIVLEDSVCDFIVGIFNSYGKFNAIDKVAVKIFKKLKDGNSK
jgi:hypothetical protein